MKTPENFEQFEQKETPNLEIQTLDPVNILITEHNIQKRGDKELFGDTFGSVISAIESGKTSEIPPIVVFQNPFGSIENTIKVYHEYIKVHPRQGGRYYNCEDEVLNEILEQNNLLCYNGNSRLEEFQKAKIPIKAFVIKSQKEFMQIPLKEKRIPEKLKSERSVQYEIDQNYFLSYLALLDDTIYILAEKKHWDNFDTSKLTEALRERRKKR